MTNQLFEFWTRNRRARHVVYLIVFLVTITYAAASGIVLGTPESVVAYRCIVLVVVLMFGLPLIYIAIAQRMHHDHDGSSGIALGVGPLNDPIKLESRASRNENWADIGRIIPASGTELPTPEFAHVLFVDIVGFSRLPADTQNRVIQKLQSIVQSTAEYQKGTADNRLVSLPTGDGMALAFFHGPMSPVNCAAELARSLQNHPEIPLRMGIHSGLVYPFKDIRGNSNVAGGGINLAQRVMDYGDAGHILLSKTAADTLQLEEWVDTLTDLGLHKVKHGVKVHIFNLHTGVLGNSALPSKILASRRKETRVRLLFAAMPPSILLISVLLIYLWFARRHLLEALAVLPRPDTMLHCAGIPSLAAGKYLAVLPFRGEGSFGVAEAVYEKLSTEFPNLPKFRISSNVDAVAKGGSPQKAACDLGANLIVQGNIVDARDGIRVHWTLEDMEHGKSLIDENVLKQKRDVLSLVNDICSRITTVLELKPQQASPPIEKLDVYALYGEGQRAIHDRGDANRFDVAFQFYNRALTLDPNFALAYAGLADACSVRYDETKVPEWASKAELYADQAVAMRETLLEGQLSLGTAYTATGKTALAIQHLKRALELRPNSDSAYRRLGRAYLKAGEKDNAIAAFKNAVDESPYYWNNHYELGLAYTKIGRRNEALREFRIIQDLWPDQALGYAGAAGVYYVQGKFQDAKVAYEKAITLEPSLKYSSCSNLGTVDFFLKDYKGAIVQFELAVKINPNDDVVRMNLADAYRWSKQHDKANVEYDAAINLAKNLLSKNPKDPTTIGNMALYYAKRGDPRMGLAQIKSALASDGDNPELIYDNAVIKTLAKQPGAALAALRKLLLTGYSIKLVVSDPELNEGLRNQRSDDFDKLIKEFEKKSP